MKRAIASLMFASMFVLGVVPDAHAGKDKDKGCANDTLKGDYLFTTLGLSRSDRPNPTQPTVAAGVRTFDGEGNLSQVATASIGGQIKRQVVEIGTYTLDSDCIGTMAIQAASGGVRTWDIFVATDGSEGVGTGTGTDSIAHQTFKSSTPSRNDSR